MSSPDYNYSIFKHHQTLLGPNHAARVSVSRNAFLSSCSEKNCFDVNIVVKKHKNGKIEMWLSWSVLLSTTSTHHTSFLKHFLRIVFAC